MGDYIGDRLLCIVDQTFSRAFLNSQAPFLISPAALKLDMQRADVEQSRDKLRKAALSQRRMFSPADCVVWSQAIQSRALALPIYCAADSVALYSPIQNEVETRAICDNALAGGKKVFYPKFTANRSPGFARIHSPTELIVGRFGFLEPAGTDSMSSDGYDKLIVFVPGVAFDPCGHRLGRGGGWYDRVLCELDDHAVFIGLAYQRQMVEHLPTEKWDQRVHYIITEKDLIDGRKGCQSFSGVSRVV